MEKAKWGQREEGEEDDRLEELWQEPTKVVWKWEEDQKVRVARKDKYKNPQHNIYQPYSTATLMDDTEPFSPTKRKGEEEGEANTY